MYSGPATGLCTSPNPFSSTPAGTLKRADNVRFIAPGILAPRRGLPPTVATFGNSASRADALAFYGAVALVAYDLTKVSLYTGSFSDFSGTFEPVGANRMRFEGAARSVFFNTLKGLQVWDGTGVAGQPVVAGNPQGLNILADNNSADGWQDGDTAVGFRFTICSKDAFGRIIEGPPSGRTVLRNLIRSTFGTSGVTRTGGTTVHATTDLPHGLTTGNVLALTPGEADFPAGSYSVVVDNAVQFHYAQAGANVSATVTQTWNITRSADVTAYLPVDPNGNPVTTSNFLRFYRSQETLTANDTPSDELWLVYESAFLTATNIAAGFLTFNDVAPESSFEVGLYTNNNEEGQTQANYEPPRALDHVYWANRMWFANSTSKHSLLVSLLGCGSPDGLQDGDTITFIPNGGTIVDNVTFTAKTNPVGVGDFQLYGDPIFFPGDPGFNIQRTAQALCQAINDYPSFAAPPVYAFYISDEGGVPGKMLFQARQFSDASDAISFANGFTVYSSRATAWNPSLPPAVAPPFLVASSDNAHPAWLWWSRIGQPEAVPLFNNTPVNSDNDAILRIFPLHYRLIIFKTDGIYSCSNVEPFSIQKISAFVLLAPDSLQVLEDRLYALTDQGLVTISDAGVERISSPIDDMLNALNAPLALPQLISRTFGLTYRSERQYLLWTIDRDGQSFTADAEQAHPYSTLSGGFTRYVVGARCGAVDPTTNTLLLAPTDRNNLLVELKSLTSDDYRDELLTIGNSASSGSDIELVDASEVEVGDVIAKVIGTTVAAYLITAVVGNVVTVLGTPGWGSGSSFVAKAIPCAIEFNKLTAGAPATMKMVQQASLLFRQNTIRDTVANFHSEIQTVDQPVHLVSLGWGETPWGEAPWGNPTEQIRRIEPLPGDVANCCQLSVGFETRQAFASFEFLGLDVVQAEDTSANHG